MPYWSNPRGISPMSDDKTRLEHDSLGAVPVPEGRLWGAQTQRSLQHFRISDEKMPGSLIFALTRIKKAAALVNVELGELEPRKGDAIAAAADEVLAGRHD